MSDLSLQPVTIAAFRKDLKAYYENAVKSGTPVAISRAHEPDVGVMISAKAFLAGTAGTHFKPTVHSDGDQIEVWLPELDIYGIGETAEQAEIDLLDELREYVREYFAEGYGDTPNRAGHLPFVLRAMVADLLGELHQVIFEPAIAGA